MAFQQDALLWTNLPSPLPTNACELICTVSAYRSLPSLCLQRMGKISYTPSFLSRSNLRSSVQSCRKAANWPHLSLSRQALGIANSQTSGSTSLCTNVHIGRCSLLPTTVRLMPISPNYLALVIDSSTEAFPVAPNTPSMMDALLLHRHLSSNAPGLRQMPTVVQSDNLKS